MRDGAGAAGRIRAGTRVEDVYKRQSDGRERAVLVAVVRDDQDPRQAAEFLDELEFLAETADIESVQRFTQRLPQPSSRIYVGPGKREEIAGYCKDQEIDCLLYTSRCV